MDKDEIDEFEIYKMPVRGWYHLGTQVRCNASPVWHSDDNMKEGVSQDSL